MTPSERAENIRKAIFASDFQAAFDGPQLAKAIDDYIAAEIRQAVDEALKDREVLYEKDLKHRMARAKSEAFEEAAKAAETPYYRYENENRAKCYECDCHGEVPQDYIAAQIRALKEKG